MNYHRAFVRFIGVISVYLAQVLVHTAKTLVISRARLLPRYVICIYFSLFPYHFDTAVTSSRQDASPRYCIRSGSETWYKKCLDLTRAYHEDIFFLRDFSQDT